MDQVFQEVSLNGNPVRFCMDRAGLVGGDGAVHHGFMDVAYLRSLPGINLLAVHDEPTLKAALAWMLEHDEASALRYPRDNVPEKPVQAETPPFVRGKANLVAPGDDLAVLAYGFPVHAALEARSQLAAEGHSIAVYDARFAKPVDVELIRALAESDTPMLTVEDHHVDGGFGSCVLEACNAHKIPAVNLQRLGLPDRWIYQGGRGEQQAEAGIDAAGIAAKALEMLDEKAAAPRKRSRSRSIADRIRAIRA